MKQYHWKKEMQLSFDQSLHTDNSSASSALPLKIIGESLVSFLTHIHVSSVKNYA